MHTQLIIDNGQFVMPHAACTYSFIIHVAVTAEECIKLRVAGTIGPGVIFLATIFGIGGLLEYVPRYPQAAPQRIAVAFLGQIICVDDRLRERIGRPNMAPCNCIPAWN